MNINQFNNYKRNIDLVNNLKVHWYIKSVTFIDIYKNVLFDISFN